MKLHKSWIDDYRLDAERGIFFLVCGLDHHVPTVSKIWSPWLSNKPKLPNGTDSFSHDYSVMIKIPVVCSTVKSICKFDLIATYGTTFVVIGWKNKSLAFNKVVVSAFSKEYKIWYTLSFSITDSSYPASIAEGSIITSRNDHTGSQRVLLDQIIHLLSFRCWVIHKEPIWTIESNETFTTGLNFVFVIGSNGWVIPGPQTQGCQEWFVAGITSISRHICITNFVIAHISVLKCCRIWATSASIKTPF